MLRIDSVDHDVRGRPNHQFARSGIAAFATKMGIIPKRVNRRQYPHGKKFGSPRPILRNVLVNVLQTPPGQRRPLYV